jgi:hypothetical protein
MCMYVCVCVCVCVIVSWSNYNLQNVVSLILQLHPFCEHPHAGRPYACGDSKSGVKIQFILSFHIPPIRHLQLLFFLTL